MQLTTIDWTIIIAYFTATLAIGLLFGRRAGKSLSEYFVSGRSLPWWIAGTSMVATTFAADTPLAVTGLVIKNGLAGNWFWWAFALGGMFTVFVYARLWRRAEVMTDVELIEIRYGGKPAAALRGLRALYIALLVNPIIIGWVSTAMLTVLRETVFHSDELAGTGAQVVSDWAILASCLAIVGVYCTLSGMWGVALTDFFQFFLAMLGCILLAVVAVKHVGGVAALQEQVGKNFGDSQQAFAFIPDFSGDNAWIPVHVFLIMLLMQWWATWFPGAEPGGGGYIVQRMAACKDERHSLLATLWFQLAHYCVRPWPWLLVAFVALAMRPELRTSYLADAEFDPGVGFPIVIRELAPAGLRGLLLVTFLAAFMSTVSTQMNWGASYLVRDVYQRFINPAAKDGQLLWVSRMASILVLAVGGFASWVMREKSVDDAWKMLAALGAGTGAVFMLRWFWWRINAWTEIVAMVASLILFQLIGPASDSNPLRVVTVSSPELQMMVVALLTIVTWFAVTLLTPAENNDTLLAFYRKVRPGGPGWRPIAEQAPNARSNDSLGLSILAAIVAAGIVYFTIPGVGSLIFGDYATATMCLASAVACGIVVKLLLDRIGWQTVA